MQSIIWVIHLLAAAAIIGLVLIQHGKGADVGAAFGSGSAGSLFGASGASNFLSRTTATLAAVFFVTSLGLTYFSGSGGGGVMDKHPAAKEQPQPAAPAQSAAPATAPAAKPGADQSKAQDIPK